MTTATLPICSECQYEIRPGQASHISVTRSFCAKCDGQQYTSNVAMNFTGRLQTVAQTMGIRGYDEDLNKQYPQRTFLDTMQPICQWTSLNSETGHIEGKIVKDIPAALKFLMSVTDKLSFESTRY